MKINRWIAALTLLFILVSLASQAAADYASPLRVQVRASYPQKVRTVGQAASHLLETIDYRVIVNGAAPLDAPGIARMGIGPQARTGEILPLEEILLLLVGEQNRVVVDYEHRLVSFEAMPGGLK